VNKLSLNLNIVCGMELGCTMYNVHTVYIHLTTHTHYAHTFVFPATSYVVGTVLLYTVSTVVHKTDTNYVAYIHTITHTSNSLQRRYNCACVAYTTHMYVILCALASMLRD